jgi:hypothetical protein
VKFFRNALRGLLAGVKSIIDYINGNTYRKLLARQSLNMLIRRITLVFPAFFVVVYLVRLLPIGAMADLIRQMAESFRSADGNQEIG